MKSIREVAQTQKNRRVRVAIIVLLLIFSVTVDYLSGPIVQFPILFLIPIALIAWYNGKVWGIIFSILLPLLRMGFIIFWTVPWTIGESIINTSIRIIVFSLFTILIDKAAVRQKQLSQRIKNLEGLLPVCCFCKKIRTDKGNWEQIEKYISDHSEAQFSHGLCPECAELHYPGMAGHSGK